MWSCFAKTVCISAFTIVTSCIISSIVIAVVTSNRRPPSIEFQVTDASLTQFNLINNNTLYYNLKVNITARNPHKDIKVHYLKIMAIAWYKDREFCRVRLLPPYDQLGQESTTSFETIVFEGQSVIDLKPSHVAEYNMETSVGVYNDLAVDLDLLIRTEKGVIMSWGPINPPLVKCKRLSVPLISNSKTASPFNGVKCSPCYLIDLRW